jgi:hypothetical protein
MKKLMLCLVVVFAFAFTAAAQDTGASQSATHSSKKSMSSSGSRTTTGCIEKSGDSYMLKNGRYKNGVKVTGSDDLSAHVGHTVKLTGSWTTPGQEFSETKVDMVSDTCKMGGNSMSATGTKSGKKKGASSSSAGSTPPSL